MPAGHVLEEIYCSEVLTCAAPVETTLYGGSTSALNLPLVDFSKGVCSICGIVEVSAAARKEQKCRGDKPSNWDAFPLCDKCAARGFVAEPVRTTQAQAKQAARARKHARAPAERAAAHARESSSSD